METKWSANLHLGSIQNDQQQQPMNTTKSLTANGKGKGKLPSSARVDLVRLTSFNSHDEQYEHQLMMLNEVDQANSSLNFHSESSRLNSGSSEGEKDFDEESDADECDAYLHHLHLHGRGGIKAWACCKQWRLYKGIVYSCLSSVFFSLCSVIVKCLDNIHPGELAVFRFIGILLLTLPMVIHHGGNPFGPPELRHFLILRGIAGATSLFLRFHAFRYLPIADASVIIFSVPVFVSIFAWMFLKEPCGVFQWFTVLLTMVGLAMTTKLPLVVGPDGELNANPDLNWKSSNDFSHFDAISASNSSPHLYSSSQNQSIHLLNQSIAYLSEYATQQEHISNSSTSWREIELTQRNNHLYGVMSALGSTGFGAAVFIFIRKAKATHHSIIMFNFGWVAIIETSTITALMNGFTFPTTLTQWTLITLLGIFSFAGQMLLTRSLQLEQAGPVSVVRAATDIALAFVWQCWLFNDVPDVWSIGGALLVTTCIVLTSFRKWLITLPEHSVWRERLFWFTI